MVKKYNIKSAYAQEKFNKGLLSVAVFYIDSMESCLPESQKPFPFVHKKNLNIYICSIKCITMKLNITIMLGDGEEGMTLPIPHDMA